MHEIFRPRSNFIWASSALVLIALFAVNSLLVLDSMLQTTMELIFSVVLAVTAHIVWIRPKMVLKDETIEVVNPLSKTQILYRDILELETKWSLTIVHSGGRTNVFVAPASGKRKWIADKTFGWYGSGVPLSDSKETDSQSMSESLDSLSGQAAYLIRERLKRLH